MMSLKPYEEMSPLEVVTHWLRMKAKGPHRLTLFQSPNHSLWAVVDEQKLRTIEMWDVNTGRHIKGERCPLYSDTWGCFSRYWTNEGLRPKEIQP